MESESQRAFERSL